MKGLGPRGDKLNHDISLSIRPLLSLLLECGYFGGANIIIAQFKKQLPFFHPLANFGSLVETSLIIT